MITERRAVRESKWRNRGAVTIRNERAAPQMKLAAVPAKAFALLFGDFF